MTYWPVQSGEYSITSVLRCYPGSHMSDNLNFSVSCTRPLKVRMNDEKSLKKFLRSQELCPPPVLCNSLPVRSGDPPVF